jgi:hypothetical protein
VSRVASTSPPDDLFDAIARLLEPDQREYFYRRMVYFRQLRPEDELLRLVEAMGLLALLIRDAPRAVAVQREHLAQLLETRLAQMQAAAAAEQTDRQQLADRLAALPAAIAQAIRPEAIARSITESVRQQFLESGLPAIADTLTATAQQVAHATGNFQNAANELRACAGIADRAHRAVDTITTSLTDATETARQAVITIRREFSLESLGAVWLLGVAVWMFGVCGGLVFERWWIGGVPVVAQPRAGPAPAAEPSPPAAPVATPPSPAAAHDGRPAASHARRRDHASKAAHGTSMEQPSNSPGTASSAAAAKP